MHVRDRIIPLQREQIAFCYTFNEKVTAYGYDGTAYPLDKTLEALQALLPEAEFFRANRQFIIARRAVKEIARVVREPPYAAPYGRNPRADRRFQARAPEFKEWLKSVHPVE